MELKGSRVAARIKAWLTDRKQCVTVKEKTSGLRKVWSGVPQGSVLGPAQFHLFINDLDSAVTERQTIKKFAQHSTAQHSLDSLCEWTRRWGMAFNGAKCQVMRLGLRNPGHAYYMNGIRLDASEKERDVDVTISSSLKPAQQCKKAAQTALAVLAQIIRAFHCRDRHVFLSLYQQCQSYFWPQGHNLQGEAQRTGDAQPTGEED